MGFYGLGGRILALGWGLSLALSSGVMAEDGDDSVLKVHKIPWPKGNYYHFSKNQDLAELLKDFCTMQGISIIVSPTIKETVNGRFSDIAPEQFWNDIVSAYNLIWFFDGNILYVYENSQVQTQVWSMTGDEMHTLCRVIDELGIASSHLSIRRLERAGILVISGPPRLIAIVGELSQKIVIERIDEIADIRIFPLKHAWAYDMSIASKDGNVVIPGVATMLRQLLVSKQTGEGSVGASIFSLSNADKTKAQPKPDLVEGRAMIRNKKLPTDEINIPEASSGQNICIGDTLISFDARLNAVIIRGKKQNMPFLEGVIQELDIACKVIRIDVAIVDIDQKAAMELGTDLIKMANGSKTRTFSLSPKGEFRDSSALKSNIQLPLNGVIKGFNVESYLQALEEKGNAQTMARPSILTIDNIGATIERSNTFYVKVAGTKTEGLYDVSASTKLRVVPHIVPGEFNAAGNAKIKLFIEVADGSVTQKTEVNAGTPTTDNNMINTQAVLYEGQSLVIGGYFNEMHNTAEVGLPLLMNIPILGYFFKFKEIKKEVRERIYVITPRVVNVDGDPDADTRRFFQKGNLEGVATLSPSSFALTEEVTAQEEPWPLAPVKKPAISTKEISEPTKAVPVQKTAVPDSHRKGSSRKRRNYR
jgi:type III secretion protein C